MDPWIGLMKVIRTAPQIVEQDPMYKDFFDGLLQARLRVGYDEKTQQGIVDMSSWGDIGFELGSDKVWVWFNEKTSANGYIDGAAASRAIVSFFELTKKISP